MWSVCPVAVLLTERTVDEAGAEAAWASVTVTVYLEKVG